MHFARKPESIFNQKYQMKTKRYNYEEPACEVVKLQPQQVIAASTESLNAPGFEYGDDLDLD